MKLDRKTYANKIMRRGTFDADVDILQREDRRQSDRSRPPGSHYTEAEF